ncbi:N-acetyl-D-Glu racemase DgcA [Desertibaculum subflavum]|uniref:N-acetyl-D-Glu racemase DgcA n=1 Tax=Desertibaculum subflavum TaxID=2268458 RepID=UPI000E66989E
MKLSVDVEVWPIEGGFTISRGSRTEQPVVVARLMQDGVTGHGECVPYPRYGESIDNVVAAIEAARPAIEAGLTRQGLLDVMQPGAARNAVDGALWDLEAKWTGKPAWQIAGLPEPKPLVTCFTLSLGTPESMRAKAREAADRPLLKVKLGGEGDLERMAAVREGAPKARLVADANEAWTADMLEHYPAELAKLGVEMIEQPLKAGADDWPLDMPRPVPLCADESCHGIDHLDRLAGRYDLVNVKLDKTGGLTAALALVQAARAKGFGVMLGCMVGTSLGMAPAFLAAQLARYVDLDGPLILSRDRVPGIRFEGSLMHPPPRELWG